MKATDPSLPTLFESNKTIFTFTYLKYTIALKVKIRISAENALFVGLTNPIEIFSSIGLFFTVTLLNCMYLCDSVISKRVNPKEIRNLDLINFRCTYLSIS